MFCSQMRPESKPFAYRSGVGTLRFASFQLLRPCQWDAGGIRRGPDRGDLFGNTLRLGRPTFPLVLKTSPGFLLVKSTLQEAGRKFRGNSFEVWRSSRSSDLAGAPLRSWASAASFFLGFRSSCLSKSTITERVPQGVCTHSKSVPSFQFSHGLLASGILLGKPHLTAKI